MCGYLSLGLYTPERVAYSQRLSSGFALMPNIIDMNKSVGVYGHLLHVIEVCRYL